MRVNCRRSTQRDRLLLEIRMLKEWIGGKKNATGFLVSSERIGSLAKDVAHVAKKLKRHGRWE